MLNFITGLSDAGRRRVISTQEQFDSLVIDPYDNIILNGVFHGSLLIDQNDVTIQGGGIKGSFELTGWIDELDGTYSLTQSQPNWLFNNGSVMKMAETDWITVTGSPAANQLTINHNEVSGYSDIVDSILICRSRGWKNDKYTVVAYDDAGTITLNKNLVSSYEPNSYLKLLGKVDYFAFNNEWAYEGGKLYVKYANIPSGIRETETDNIITIAAENATIKDTDLSEFFYSAILRNTGDNLKVQRCTIHEGRGVGVVTEGYELALETTDNTIYNCGYGGILSRTDKIPNIQRNDIYNIGTLDNTGYNIDSGVHDLAGSNNAGIVLHCDNDQDTEFANGGNISYNTIYNIAYCGIKIRGQNNTISRNILHDVMTDFWDGGAIYSFGGNSNATVINATGNHITNNFIYNVLGGSLTSSFEYAPGIYLDNESIANFIRYNTVYNTTGGLLVSSDNDANTTENNICFYNLFYQLWIRTGYTGGVVDVNDKNVINDNQMVCSKSNEYSFFVQLRAVEPPDPDYNPYDNGGEADNNYYINAYNTIIANDFNAGDLTLSQLRTLYSQDVNSIEQTNYITPPGTPSTDAILITNPSDNVLNGTAPGGYKDVDGNPVTNYTINPWSSLVLLNNLP